MRKQERTIILVAGIDIISIAVKFVLAAFTGSLSLLADAWHSISDLVTSIMVFFALVFDRREEEKSLNASEAKARFIRKSSWEPRVCIFIGIALIAVSASVFKKVYTGSTLDIVRHPMVAAIIVLFLIFLSFIRFNIEESVGHETKSPALMADAYHSRVDIYVLSMVLLSFVAEILQLRIDRWVAGYIALLILYIAIKTIFRSLKMMFRLSSETNPEDRTVEDAVILLMIGKLNFSKSRGFIWLDSHFHFTDLTKRRRWIRQFIFGVSLSLAIIWLISGYYIVKPSEKAIVEHFGSPVNSSHPIEPGLHYAWPFPISNIRHVDVYTMRSMRLGYKTKERKDLILWTNVHYVKEFSILSGDGAIIDLAANLHYRISAPVLFLYSTLSPINCLEMLSNQVLRETTGTLSLFQLLTHERDNVEEQIKVRVQNLVDKHKLGVEIIQLCLLDVHPPIMVAPAFEDVVSAQEDLETYIEQARGYGKETLPLAMAEAYTQRKQAQAYKFNLKLKSQGRSEAFKAKNTAFKLHKSINRYRMRLANLDHGLQGKKLWLVDPNAVDNPLDIYISPAGNLNPASNLIPSEIGLEGGDTVE